MEFIDCAICMDRKEAGYSCKVCNISTCVPCEVALEKSVDGRARCPFCREQYPSMVERIASKLKAYEREIVAQLERARASELSTFEYARKIVQLLQKRDFDLKLIFCIGYIREDVLKIVINLLIEQMYEVVLEDVELSDWIYEECLMLIEKLSEENQFDFIYKLNETYEACDNKLWNSYDLKTAPKSQTIKRTYNVPKYKPPMRAPARCHRGYRRRY